MSSEGLSPVGPLAKSTIDSAKSAVKHKYLHTCSENKSKNLLRTDAQGYVT